MKKISTIVSTLAVVFVVSASAEVREIRNHYIVLERDRKPAFEVTRIHNDADSQVTRTYLIADERGPLLRVDVLTDYPARKTAYSVATLRDGDQRAKIELSLPFVSTTREARREELRNASAALAHAPVPVTISGPSGNLTGEYEDWRSSNGATARGNTHAVLGGKLVSALRNVREIAGLPMFAEINELLQYVLEDSMIVRQSQKLMVSTGRADCAFDARFGVPCPE